MTHLVGSGVTCGLIGFIFVERRLIICGRPIEYVYRAHDRSRKHLSLQESQKEVEEFLKEKIVARDQDRDEQYDGFHKIGTLVGLLHLSAELLESGLRLGA